MDGVNRPELHCQVETTADGNNLSVAVTTEIIPNNHRREFRYHIISV